MRSFLDAWKESYTHRAWGTLAFLYGAGMLVQTAVWWSLLGWVDRGLAIGLCGVLCADGLLNLLPSWFGHFKERMQDAWVKRHGRTQRAGDRHLFGTVNLFLGMASVLVAVLVYWHRPLPVVWIGCSAAIALGLMAGLIVACRAEKGERSPGVSRPT